MLRTDGVDIGESVTQVIVKCSDQIFELLRRYEERAVKRRESGFPVICFVGHGRAGKDYCGDALSSLTDRPVKSTSSAMLPYWSEALGLTKEETFAHRHEHREFLFEWTNEFRRRLGASVPTRLALAEADITLGIRSKIELEECVEQKVVDQLIWVDREVPVDPTLEYNLDDVLRLGGFVFDNRTSNGGLSPVDMEDAMKTILECAVERGNANH